jgi:hypothetical protein
MLAVVSANSALADDGVFEINQSCVATGCFPLDGAGFPIEVKKAGSYILTSNIDVRGEPDPENVTAIFIQPSGTKGTFTIDLNGFSIVGPQFCTQTPPTSCSDPGTGIGIDGTANEVTIKNGTIKGMGDDCIQSVTAWRIEDMYITECTGDGVQIGSAGFVLNSVIWRNGGDGISGNLRAFVKGNIISANVGFGLDAGTTVGYLNNVFHDNVAGDIDAGPENLGGNMCGSGICP